MVLSDFCDWFPRYCSLLVVGCVLAAVGGCSSNAEPEAKTADNSQQEASADVDSAEPGEQEVDEDATAATEEEATSEEVASDQPFVLGNAIEPFDPPGLEEIDKTAQWIDNPVLDAEAQLRKELAEEDLPEVSAEQALKLRNDSPENNAKILAAMGKLADEDGENVDYGSTFVRNVSGDLKSTNPIMSSSVTDSEYNSYTGIGFLSFDRHFNYFAPKETTVSWQTSKDGLIDKLVIRDDLTWSDGEPITAHDIEFTFKVLLTDHPDLVVPAMRQGTDKLRYVKAYDDQTVVFFHQQPYATNTPNMIFSILPKHIYEKTLPEDPSMKRSERHRELEDNPVVGGAYQLKEWVRNQEFVVTRRDDYYLYKGKQVRPKPYFESVRVKVITDDNTALLAMKKGDIEEMVLRPEQWSSQTNGKDFYKNNTKVTEIEWTNFFFQYNLKTPYFADRKVRLAMAYAMDYDELLNTIARGLYQQSQGTLHPDSWMYPKDAPAKFEQDLDKAEDLLDEAGWDDSDGDGIRDKKINGRLVPFEFSLMCLNVDVSIQISTLLKECLDQIGIVVNVKPTEFAVLQQKNTDHEFDASFGGWGTAVDPDSNENIFGTGATRNYGQYSNPRVDELFQQGRLERDKEKRAEIYAQIHKQLWEDQPYTWLYYRPAFYAFSKKLRGYHFSPRGPYSFSPGVSSIYAPVAQP